MKKLLSLVLAFAMLLSVCVLAHGEEAAQKSGRCRRSWCGIHRGCLGRPSRLDPSTGGFAAASGQKAGGQCEGQRQSDCLFHFSISFKIRFPAGLRRADCIIKARGWRRNAQFCHSFLKRSGKG